MTFQWLKRYMPRGLYGRAALILVLPVVVLQLVISIVFIQRHFEGVTEQMTDSIVKELRLLLESPPDERSGLAEALDFTLSPVSEADVPDGMVRQWYDFAGIIVARELQRRLPELRGVALPTDRVAIVYLEDADQVIAARFDRLRISASNPHQLLVTMVFFGVLMTIISFLYLRNQLRPITRLAAAAEAFGRGRSLPYRPSGAVEVRQAGNAFIDMRNRIERQMEQRTLMLSGVSHDLRTPLTRLRLGLSLSDDPGAEDMTRDVIEMERMLGEFLDFARGDAESAEAEATDPMAFVRGIVADMRRSGGQAEIVHEEGAGHVMLRQGAMRRAIENLITNATRYGSRAEISVIVTEKALRIRVEDDGPGIPAADRDAALRPFVRLDSARNQDRGSGVGLGLAITLDIIRAHGGSLRLTDSPRLGGLAADIVIAR